MLKNGEPSTGWFDNPPLSTEVYISFQTEAMADVQHWQCPYCNHDATLRDQDYASGGEYLIKQDPIEGHKYLAWYYVVCPNPDCRRYTLRIGVFHANLNKETQAWETGETVKIWDLIPPSTAKIFPEYIPKPILDDYNEACMIAELSPKASATLSRRCLQGIIRNFWEVKPGRLVDEIAQIEDKTDRLTWDAIDSVRRVGNIGAHMEKDIDVIVDVDPNEARMLIGLIEILFKDWYVAREERRSRLLKIKSIAEEKKEVRKA